MLFSFLRKPEVEPEQFETYFKYKAVVNGHDEYCLGRCEGLFAAYDQFRIRYPNIDPTDNDIEILVCSMIKERI